MTLRLLASVALLALLGSACSQAAPSESYTPGLGELMTLQQMRHARGRELPSGHFARRNKEI